MEYIGIVVAAALVNNFVLHQYLGLCPFVGATHNLKHSLRLAAATALVLLIAVPSCWLLFNYLLVPAELQVLRLISFVVLVASLVSAIRLLSQRYAPLAHRALGVYLPLITSNCAILGAILLNLRSEHSLATSVLYACGAGLGLWLATYLLGKIRLRLQSAQVPKFWQGKPIALISAGILAVAFMGFA